MLFIIIIIVLYFLISDFQNSTTNQIQNLRDELEEKNRKLENEKKKSELRREIRRLKREIDRIDREMEEPDLDVEDSYFQYLSEKWAELQLELDDYEFDLEWLEKNE